MFTHRFVAILALAITLSPLSASAQTATSAPVPTASGSAMAGSHHSHHRRSHHHSLMHALAKLNLSDAQKQQVAGFRAAQKQADANADPATKRANAAKLHQQVMGVLTRDQATQLQQYEKPAAARTTNDAPLPAATP